MSNRWICRLEPCFVALLAIAIWGWGSDARAERRALLVGCTHYPNMAPALQLVGPANDVRLLRTVLSKDYDFSPRNMRILAEEGGDAAPTRANIEKEFAHLAEVAQPNDFIFILLAGHGTQQPVPPDNDPLTHYKPDGMDEVFCPRDIGGIEANRSGRIANGIVDSEMHVWLTAILRKKAFVWIVFDACHSATMIRGNGAERTRAIDPGLLLPKQALADAQKRKSPPLAGAIPHALTEPADEKNFSYVAMYACQAAETELEGRYPNNSPDVEDHGLLTYALVRALEVCRRAPITYRELVQRIQSDYISMRKSSSTPLLEGPDQNRFVLDQNSAGRPLSIRLSHGDNQKWKIDAGAVHGLGQGSVLAVYPPPGESKLDQLLGHVVITRLGIPESQVGPCDASGKPVDDPLPEAAQGGRCELVFLDLGLDRLRFTVDDCDVAGNPLPRDRSSQREDEWKRLAGELRGLVLRDPRSLLHYVDDRKQADWLVRVGQNRVVLVPGSGWPTASGGDGPPGFEPDRKAAGPAEGVKSALEVVARASNLVRLATKQREATAIQFGKDLNVELSIKLLANEKDKEGKPLDWQRNGKSIQVGARTMVQIENREDFDVDVTLLYVDSQFGITPIFPEPGSGELNRLPGHAVKPIGPNEVSGDTTGLEHLVLLVAPVHAEQLPADFSFLRQPPLQVAVREKNLPRQRVRDVRGASTPLDDLLATVIDGQGSTRGPWARMKGQYAMRVISMQVMPQGK